MQASFWWWQCSDRYIISLFPNLHTPFPPSLISRTVSVDVKHHVYYLLTWCSICYPTSEDIKNQRTNNWCPRVQELCDSRGGRPGLPVPNSPSPWYSRTGWLGLKHQFTYLLTIIVLTASVDVKQHWTRTYNTSGAAWKSRWPSWAPYP